MDPSYKLGQAFVAQVRPLIEAGDQDDLGRHLSRYWPNYKLRSLLDSGHPEAVKTAMICLSLTGTMADSAAVSLFLPHQDDDIADLAERTMWAIWFRAGDQDANTLLQRAIELLDQNKTNQALDLLTELIKHNPAFAEAYNQRAIAYHLKGDYVKAIDDCKEALRLNEHHFCAMADLGHGYASLGQFQQALQAYQGSLKLHPRQRGVRQTMEAIQQGHS